MSPPCLLCIPMHSLIMRNRSGSSCLGCRKCWASAAKAETPTRIVPTVRAPISVFISANSGAKADMAARRMRANSGLLLRVARGRSQCFGCTRLVRLLDELVNPRLEHLAELLVEGIAEGAAGAGETGRLRGGVRAGVAGLGRRRGRAYCLRPRGFPGAPRRWRGRCSCSEAAPDERCGCARPARSWPRISPATFRSCPRRWS